MKGPVRILIVDDSTIFADVMTKAIKDSARAELAGVAVNGREGVDLVRSLHPDVISMDVHMPVMDGLDAIEHIMDETPTPIAVVTAAASEEMARIGFRAIGSGALDVLEKPASPREARALVDRLCILSRVTTRRHARRGAEPPPRPAPIQDATTPVQPWRPGTPVRSVDLVGIAISTGGPPVLERVLGELPATYRPGVLVVQHLSPGFDAHLAEWLNHGTQLDVRLAGSGDRVEPGVVWIAPANHHLAVRMGGRLEIDREGDRVHGHRPSGTVLLNAIARTYGRSAAGLVLTGMGDDGADGLLALRRAGGITAAQDAASSAVDGMPRSARERGAAEYVVALDDLAAFLRALDGPTTRARA